MNGSIKLDGLEGMVSLLRSLPEELVSRRGGPVLAALKAGARIILEQEKINLAQVIAKDDKALGYTESIGLLMSSLVISRGKEPSDGNGERVLIRVKRKRYPGRTGVGANTVQVAQLLEHGRARQPARMWIRPAFNAKAEEAIKTVEADLLARVDRIVAKLAAANKGK